MGKKEKKKMISKRQAGRSHTAREELRKLSEEVVMWDRAKLIPKDFIDAPEAVPRSSESTAISMRIPFALLEILKAFAEQNGIGYQVLMKQWLDERIKMESEGLRSEARRTLEKTTYRAGHSAPTFPIIDQPDTEQKHYHQLRRG